MKELDRWLAAFMKFHFIETSSGELQYIDKSSCKFVCLFNDWHPTTSIEQAMMCVEKLKGDNYRFIFKLFADINEAYVYKHDPCEYDATALTWHSGKEPLELAICLAIRKAVEK